MRVFVILFLLSMLVCAAVGSFEKRAVNVQQRNKRGSAKGKVPVKTTKKAVGKKTTTAPLREPEDGEAAPEE